MNYREESLLWQPSTKQEAKYLRCHHRRKNYKENSDILKYSRAYTARKYTKDKIQINGSLGRKRDVNLVAVYSFWFIQLIQFLLITLVSWIQWFYSRQLCSLSGIISRGARLFMSPTDWIHWGMIIIKKKKHAPQQRSPLIIPLLLRRG